MVFTPERIKYLLEQARIGREKRGGHDYITVDLLEARNHIADFRHRLATGQMDGSSPFHLKQMKQKKNPPKA